MIGACILNLGNDLVMKQPCYSIPCEMVTQKIAFNDSKVSSIYKVLWNSLPEVIRKCPAMDSFKLSVKNSSFFIHTEY